MSDWPLSEGRDAPLLGPFCAGFHRQPPARVAVAVSGGGDSMALLHMALRARLHFGWQVSAVTVDHGLRSESAAEAAGVAAYCAQQGIGHAILRWQGPAAHGNLMDQARRARMALIAGWAKAQGIEHVLLGHTADDNAESFLMNLARQAGIDGLSGMRRDWMEQGISWHRPMLDLPRADLRAYLTRNHVSWVDDPSNDNTRFARVKARKAMQALRPLGITARTFGETISHLSDARHVLTLATVRAATVMDERGGALRLAVDSLAGLEPEIARRLLAATILWMNGADYPPLGAQLLHLQTKLARGEAAQLGGVRFVLRKGDLWIFREARAAMGPVSLDALWDHRWRLTGPAGLGLQIAALGAEGLHQCPDWRSHGPREALIVSPAVWAGKTLVAAPVAGLAGPYRADLAQGLAEFILSH